MNKHCVHQSHTKQYFCKSRPSTIRLNIKHTPTKHDGRAVKTEFLLIGLPQQLAEINTSSLITTHSARNLGFILDEQLTFSDQISAVLSLNLAIIIFVNSDVFVLILTSVVHSKLDYCNSLYYNLPQSQIKRPQNSFARAITRSLLFLNLYCLKINERIKYKLDLSGPF